MKDGVNLIWCKSNPNRNPVEDVKPPSKPSKIDGWECKSCHYIFRTRRELETHLSDNSSCSVYKRKYARGWECQYCYTIVKSRNCLFEHYKVCSEKLKLPHDSRGHVISQKVIDGHSKRVNTIKNLILSGEYIPKGHPHTEESKHKLSIARKENIKCNIGSRWINPHIKRSYAEQYFYDFFTKEQLQFESNKWIGKYCVDFLFGKYYLEVDGEQHYTPESIEYDKVRDLYLHELGYISLGRIRWSCFKQLSKDETVVYLSNLLTCVKVAIEDQFI